MAIIVKKGKLKITTAEGKEFIYGLGGDMFAQIIPVGSGAYGRFLRLLWRRSPYRVSLFPTPVAMSKVITKLWLVCY